jgi:transcriptional regulator of met regulon
LPEYTLADFARRLPKLWEVEAPKKTTPKIRTSSPSKVSRIGLGRNINDSQMDAIIDLIKLRVGRMSGYRERALFFFRNAYHKNEETRFYAGDKTLFEESLREVEKINEMFDEPLGAQEVRRWTLTTHTLYHITTAEMVEWFDITMDEQVQIRLKTRKAKLEKERRRSKRNRAAQGATNNEKLYEAIITAIKSNPTMKDYQVAKLVKSIVGKCSEKTVKKVRESL